MYQQREPDVRSFEIVGIWNPEVTLAQGESISLSPVPEDRYVVVDEIIEDVVRLAVAEWPSVDSAGRLRFGEEGSASHIYDRSELQEEIDRRRKDARQVTRQLRIGDLFLIGGFGPNLGNWARVLDATMAGRPAAKRAGLRAVAQPVDAELALEDSADRNLAWRRPPDIGLESSAQAPQPPSGSVANAAV